MHKSVVGYVRVKPTFQWTSVDLFRTGYDWLFVIRRVRYATPESVSYQILEPKSHEIPSANHTVNSATKEPLHEAHCAYWGTKLVLIRTCKRWRIAHDVLGSKSESRTITLRCAGTRVAEQILCPIGQIQPNKHHEKQMKRTSRARYKFCPEKFYLPWKVRDTVSSRQFLWVETHSATW